MPTPEEVNRATQSDDRTNHALELETLLLSENLISDQPVPAAELQRQLEDRLWGGNRQVLELLGRPPIRRKLYTFLGELVVLGRAEDTSEGMVFHRQVS